MKYLNNGNVGGKRKMGNIYYLGNEGYRKRNLRFLVCGDVK